MKLYLAHQISGLTGIEVIKYFESLFNDLKLYYTILSPMNGKMGLFKNQNDLCISSGYADPICNDHSVFQRDIWMVQQADVVLTDFTGTTNASIGCSMELAIASFLNKHTVVVLPQHNIHNHCFITEAADIIYPTLNQAKEYLIDLIKTT
jgi:hypothetical protein